MRSWLLSSVLLAMSALAPWPASAQPADDAPLTAVPERGSLTVRGSFYVPAYASFAKVRGRYNIDFAVTLLVHNTSGTKPLVIERIAYHNSAGELVQDELTAPVAIRPFGTLEISVPATDRRGGTGADFVVDWASAGPIAEPIMETLILGTTGTQGFSFVGQGRPIRIIGE